MFPYWGHSSFSRVLQRKGVFNRATFSDAKQFSFAFQISRLAVWLALRQMKIDVHKCGPALFPDNAEW